MQTPKTPTLEIKGTWYAIVSGMLYGLLGYFGVILMRTGLSVYNLSFWRFFIALVFVLSFALMRKHKERMPLKTVAIAVVNGGFFYSGSSIFFFLAANYIGTGQSMVIFFIYPIWLMLLNWLVLGLTFRVHYVISFVLIVVGLVLLVDVKEFSLDFYGIGFSLLASFSYAIYLFVSKRLYLSPLSSTISVSLGCSLLGLFLALMDKSFYFPSTIDQWVNLVGLAIVCTAVPILLMLEAISYISADKASLLSVLEPMFTVLFGVILLHEVLYVHTILGMIVTLIGATVAIIRVPEIRFGRLKKLS